MCSLRGVNVITLAAIFCTRCSLRSKLVETPDNNAFPQSSFDMTLHWVCGLKLLGTLDSIIYLPRVLMLDGTRRYSGLGTDN